MAPRLPDWQLNVIHHQLFDLRLPHSEVQTHAKIHRTTLWRLRLSWSLFGQPYPPSTVKKGRPAALTPAQSDRLLEYIDDRPTAYLDEMAWFLFDEFDVVVSVAALWKLLTRGGYSRKVGRHIALERNKELRAQWRAKRTYWRADRLIFIDESGANEKTGWRKYGWSPVGMPCNNKELVKRGKRWSILPAMDINGYLQDVRIVEGGVTAELFIQWIELCVLPKTRPGQILVMDNCKIHHDERLLPLAGQYGVFVEYLPPYSPDYNPIERSFCELKAWIKRHQQLISEFASFGDFLKVGLALFKAPHAKEQFEKCGYEVEVEDMA